ncbi:hypothetical protein B0H19DRAFT_1277065 [Mycena capillaripes]|nr:hypothetical protein B0H19DRAFT_1277065 [Mycena capillaripes]
MSVAAVRGSAAPFLPYPQRCVGCSLRVPSPTSPSAHVSFYTSPRPFDSDVARMFESSHRYYLRRGGSVAGVSGAEWAHVIALQRIAHAFTSTNARELTFRLAKRACARANGLFRAWAWIWV